MAKKASASSPRARRTLQNGASYSLNEYQHLGEVKRAAKSALREPTAEELTETLPWTAEELQAAIGNRKARVKQAVLVRLDQDVLAWLKSRGAGHTTRVNAILRMAMEADKRNAPSAR